MAEKILNTRLLMKIDTYSAWMDSSLVLKNGELAIATIPADTGAVQGEPAVLIKVGDNQHTFKDLPFISAHAADVYGWAKAAVKPTYTAEEIDGLSDYISGEIQDSNTQYKLEQDSTDKHVLNLYSKEINGEWALAGSITTADTVYDDTALAGRVTSLEGLVGSEKVATQIANAIAALNLANTYDAKGAAAQALVDAKAYADGKDTAIKSAKDAADAAQADVDALEGKVGTVAEGKTVVGMIEENATAAANAKTAADEAQADIDAYIASNDKALADEIARAKEAEEANAAAAEAAQGAAEAAQSDVDELAGKVGEPTEGKTIVQMIADAQTAATYDDTELSGRVSEIEKDYLTSEDKTELSNAIAAEKQRAEGIEGGLESRLATVEGDYLKKADKTELEGKITANSNAIELLTNGVSSEEVDGVNDLIQYVKDHGTEVTGINDKIKANTEAIDAIEEDYLTSADKTELQGGIDGVAGRMTTAEGKISTLEGASHTHENKTVLDGISAEKVAAWDAAEGNAKGHADSLNTAMDARVKVVEGKAHEHSNKELLDTYTQTEANLADAVAKKHEHSNKSVLDGITSEKVTAWDAAEKNAKDHADGLNTAMAARVKAVEDNKANDADLAAIAKTGNVNDLVQTEGDVLVFYCGSSSVNV